MKYTAVFIQLTDDQRSEINIAGWASKIGRAYLDSKFGNGYTDAIEFGMFEKVAEVEASSDENLWVMLQNMDTPWDERIKSLTRFARSMDVGDFAFDGSNWTRVDTFGFAPVVDEALLAHLQALL